MRININKIKKTHLNQQWIKTRSGKTFFGDIKGLNSAVIFVNPKGSILKIFK